MQLIQPALIYRGVAYIGNRLQKDSQLNAFQETMAAVKQALVYRGVQYQSTNTTSTNISNKIHQLLTYRGINY
jgi:hypothetical protein